MKFIKNIDYILENDPASGRGGLKFLARLKVFIIYPSVHALIGHSISHALNNVGLKFLARLNSQIFRFHWHRNSPRCYYWPQYHDRSWYGRCNRRNCRGWK